MGSVLQLPSQFRKDCQSKQQLFRGEIFKILGKGSGKPFMAGLYISWGGLLLETMVSFILRNFECFKWENHVFVEFLPSSSSVILWVKHKLMQFPIFLVLFLATISWKGLHFSLVGICFSVGGMGFIFQWECPMGNIGFDVESFQKTHKMEGAVPPYPYRSQTKKPI